MFPNLTTKSYMQWRSYNKTSKLSLKLFDDNDTCSALNILQSFWCRKIDEFHWDKQGFLFAMQHSDCDVFIQTRRCDLINLPAGLSNDVFANRL